MPRTVAVPSPCEFVFTSVWYQARPNGLLGVWITNRSKPVPLGRPWTLMVMVSFRLPRVIVTDPPACGRQGTPGVRTILNVNPPTLPGRLVPAAALRETASAAAAARTAAVRPVRPMAAPLSLEKCDETDLII